MTQNTTIKAPTPKALQLIEVMKEKQKQQVKKLEQKKQGVFTIII